MAVFRQIHVSFWQDSYVLELTPEQKYFYLYLMTNSKTQQCGCYQLPKKIMELETGYNGETIDKLIKVFEDADKIKYSHETKEVLLLNWSKHNFTQSPKVLKLVKKEIDNIKCPEFRNLCNSVYFPHLDTVSIEYPYSIDTVPIPNRNNNNNNKENNNNNNAVYDNDFFYNFIAFDQNEPLKATIRLLFRNYCKKEPHNNEVIRIFNLITGTKGISRKTGYLKTVDCFCEYPLLAETKKNTQYLASMIKGTLKNAWNEHLEKKARENLEKEKQDYISPGEIKEIFEKLGAVQ